MIDNCELAKVRHAKPSAVHLATREKIKVTNFIVNCEVKMKYQVARINLNIFPLWSYDMIIDMDWLEWYKVILQFSLEEISTQNEPFNFYSNSMSSCFS